MTNIDLDALIGQIAKGDKPAFEAVYRALEKPLFRFAQSKLNDPFRSADILHEVFLEVWRGAAKFEGRSSVKTWVFGIAYRKIVDVYRKEARTEVTDMLTDIADDGPDVLQCLIAAQDRVILRDCLNGLTQEHRSAVELTFFEDLGYREIALITEVPEGTVKSRVFHAKKLLMRCLESRMKPGDK